MSLISEKAPRNRQMLHIRAEQSSMRPHSNPFCISLSVSMSVSLCLSIHNCRCQLHIQEICWPPECKYQSKSCKTESQFQSCTDGWWWWWSSRQATKNWMSESFFFLTNCCNGDRTHAISLFCLNMAWRERIASKASSSDPAKVFFFSGASRCSQQAYMHDNQRKRCILLPKCYKIVVS